MAWVFILPHHTNLAASTATSVSATTAVNGLPAANVQSPDRLAVWRSQQAVTNPVNLDFDLGSVLPVSWVGVANVKLIGTGALSLYHRGDAGAPGAEVLVQAIPAQDVRTRVAMVGFVSQSHRHWRLKFTNPTAANDYAELGYAYLGVETTFERTTPDSGDWVINDPSVITPSVDRQVTTSERTQYVSGDLMLPWAPQTDIEKFDALYYSVGIRLPMFLGLQRPGGTTLATWLQFFARFNSPVTRGFHRGSVGALQMSVRVGVEEHL